MCNTSGVLFGVTNLSAQEISGKRILEVGAHDVNGGLRNALAAHNPSEYIGVDLHAGPGVDVLCDVSGLVERFGEQRFDVVIATELLEHVEHWRSAIYNLKHVLRTDGVVLITTRSPGFKYHGYPHDFWRYRPEDMEKIFLDFDDRIIAEDPTAPGVFFKARKPATFEEVSLKEVRLHSIVTSRLERTAPRDAVTRAQRNFLWHTRLRRAWLRLIDLPLRTIFPVTK